MKHMVSLALMTVLQLGLLAHPAAAQSVPKIAVLDIAAVQRYSLAGKSISEQFQAYGKAFQKEAEAHQKRLRAAQNELRLQRSLLSPEALQARERQFRDQVGEVQRKIQMQRRALEKSRDDAFKTFKKNLMQVLEKLRAERKIDLIINKRVAVIYAEPHLDLTPEVLKRLDARLKEVKLTNPGK
ncbi:MAG: OmpH family outer membrane protein [Alphaproteobacteria bacterium]|nr:OmpH family outer membrane protein [Alphaproteobacteria bacterium]